MNTVNIIGSGNVAFHLIKAFLSIAPEKTNFILQEVYARNKSNLKEFEDRVHCTDNIHKLSRADITIIAVSDQSIADVSEQIPYKNQLVVHTSGSLEMETLSSHQRKGVFYPLQTFSKQKKVDFTTVPIALEAALNQDYKILEELALLFSKQIYALNSEQRKALHVSAVFACNFVNHMYQISADICQQHQIPFEIIKPLIHETSEKIRVLSPKEAQTGPAKRKDYITLEKHNNFIINNTYKDIYNILSKSIIENE
jgi:predicted short-subunit dehydrogenase-like oxidoreductase (DUF2520 family)